MGTVFRDVLRRVVAGRGMGTGNRLFGGCDQGEQEKGLELEVGGYAQVDSVLDLGRARSGLGGRIVWWLVGKLRWTKMGGRGRKGGSGRKKQEATKQRRRWMPSPGHVVLPIGEGLGRSLVWCDARRGAVQTVGNWTW